MAKQRVQVRDLEAPERIQPAPVQSSTFAEAAKPPIDNSLEALQKGLAMFASGAQALGAKQKAEDEKRLKIEQLGAYEAWKASVSSDEHLDAIRSGQFPINVDRILDTVVKKDGAAGEARKIAEEADAKLEGRLGLSTFDPDAYVREIAAPYVARLRKDPHAMAYLGDHLDRIRGGVQKRHEEVRGQLQTQYLENRGRQEIRGGLRDGISRGMSGQEIMDGLRDPNPKVGIMSAIGPRKKGGSLDLAYGKQDDMLVDEIDNLAGDPRTVKTAIELLHAQRKTVEGGVDLGPLIGSNTHASKIDAIKKKALKTIGDATEAGMKDQIDAVNLAALERGGASFSTISDFKRKNLGDETREVSYSRDAQRDRAVQLYLDKRRRETGQVDLAAEVDFLMDRGIKHPEFEKTLNEAYTGFLSSTQAGQPALDRLPEIVKLGDEYMRLVERNPAYAETITSKDAREFYDHYRVLRRYAGMDPDKAAAMTASAFSNPEYIKDPRLLDGERQRFKDVLTGLDLNPWWPGGQVANQTHARQILMPLANALARSGGQDPKSIFEKAAAHLAETSAYVNGRIVHAPGIVKDDKPHVEKFLATLYDQHKDAFAAQGVTKGDQLSLLSHGPTTFFVVKWDTGDILRVPTGYDDKGKPSGINLFSLQSNDILKLREAGKAEAAAKGVEDLKRSTTPLAPREAAPSGKAPTDRVTEALRTGKPIVIDKDPAPVETPAQKKARQQKRHDDDRKAIESRD